MSPRRILTIAALLLAMQAAAQNVCDRQVMLDRSFRDMAVQDDAPDGANPAEKALHRIYRQFTGRDFYKPANYMFFRQAVKEIGFIPAVFATMDRVLRDSKLGTADVHMDPGDPYVEEGPEAYAPRRTGR